MSGRVGLKKRQMDKEKLSFASLVGLSQESNATKYTMQDAVLSGFSILVM